LNTHVHCFLRHFPVLTGEKNLAVRSESRTSGYATDTEDCELVVAADGPVPIKSGQLVNDRRILNPFELLPEAV
jgi:hypothetical protein